LYHLLMFLQFFTSFPCILPQDSVVLSMTFKYLYHFPKLSTMFRKYLLCCSSSHCFPLGVLDISIFFYKFVQYSKSPHVVRIQSRKVQKGLAIMLSR
jgi:hypothetical protein